MPVSVEIKLSSALRKDSQGLLAVRLTNLDPERSFGFRCRLLSSLNFSGEPKIEDELSPAEQIENSFLFASAVAGRHFLKVMLEFNADSSLPIYEGQFDFDVADPTTASPTQIINYTDARHIEGRIVVGTEGGNVSLGSSNAPLGSGAGGGTLHSGFLGSESAARDGQTTETKFVVVALHPQRSKRRTRYKSLAERYDGELPATDKLSLLIDDGRSICNVGLLAGSRVRLVRDPRSNDIALQCGPRNHDTEMLSARISRNHARLEFHPRGVAWRNLECSQGALIDGKLLESEQTGLIGNGALLAPGRVLELHATFFEYDPLPNPEPYERFLQRTLGASLGAPPIGPIQAVRLDRLKKFADRERCVVLQRGIALGSDATCAIRLSRPVGLHAHVFHLGGIFWLEACQSNFALVDDKPVELDSLVPLCPNMVVRFGEAQLHVAAFQQPSLHSESAWHRP